MAVARVTQTIYSIMLCTYVCIVFMQDSTCNIQYHIYGFYGSDTMCIDWLVTEAHLPWDYIIVKWLQFNLVCDREKWVIVSNTLFMAVRIPCGFISGQIMDR